MSKEIERKELSIKILELVGGKENIEQASHCYTRLRLTLKDVSNIENDRIKELDGVMGLVIHGNEYQVVIGPDVSTLYFTFIKVADIEECQEDKEKEKKEGSKEKKNLIMRMLDFLSGTFSPVIPVLIAGGLTGAVLTILTNFLGVASDSGTYIVFQAIQQSAFYFLPVFIGYSAAKKMNINPFLGAFMGTIMVYSTIDGAEGLNFVGIPIHATTYNTTVFPIILAVVFMGYLYRFLEKILPQVIKTIALPLLTMLITVPVVLLVLGPIGDVIGTYISNGIYAIYLLAPPIAVMLVGAATPFLVFFGMNNALYPLVFALFAAQECDPLILSGMLAANISIGAACLAVGFRAKTQKNKGIGFSTAVTALLGITEPAVYGVLFPMKRPLIAAAIGGAIGGLVCGGLGVAGYAIASPSFATIVTFISADGSMKNFYYAVLVIAISFIAAFGASWILGVDETVAE